MRLGDWLNVWSGSDTPGLLRGLGDSFAGKRRSARLLFNVIGSLVVAPTSVSSLRAFFFEETNSEDVSYALE